MFTTYASAEMFLRRFRREHIALYRKEWTGDANDIDPLTLTIQNISPLKFDDARKQIGDDLVDIFQYYRIVRNMLAHASGESLNEKNSINFEKISKYSYENYEKLKYLKAPNVLKELNFDDFLLFSRVIKILAEKLCEVARPDTGHWVSDLSAWSAFGKFLTKPERMRNAISGKLKTDYGMDPQSADWIAAEIAGSLA